ncbi:GntR family transcriptional regulator [Defluviimonas sp. WL0002]|uniref:GntR family transcriptional regulator n=1 Tax=Albidovulum marisflavi TaxID=2984159 RepID=A0ABT2ZD78_9RHOB|nr:GntR family transcriptional regulator [Defluviimonas sp. WL0002]MCV2869079.1 GntR family transcriptional regulator [Defluviimonas sp. WL0002]
MENADDMRIDYPATTLRSLAVDRLRQAIITGRFSGGERLVERSLCDLLGVSRSIVREAIRYLEAEGLVETQPRSGPVVALLDWQGARQIYDIRRLLEADAAAACARVCDQDIANRLRAALEELNRAFAHGGPLELYTATTAYYEVIFTAAGHTIAWEIVQRLNGRISRLRALTLASSNRRVSGPAHMARICDAICAGQPEAAAAAVSDHLRDAAEIARQSLESQE